MDHWTLVLLFGILLVLGVVRVLFYSLFIGLFLMVFFALLLGILLALEVVGVCLGCFIRLFPRVFLSLAHRPPRLQPSWLPSYQTSCPSFWKLRYPLSCQSPSGLPFTGLFLRVFLALAHGSPGCSLCARLLACLPRFHGLKHDRLQQS